MIRQQLVLMLSDAGDGVYIILHLLVSSPSAILLHGLSAESLT